MAKFIQCSSKFVILSKEYVIHFLLTLGVGENSRLLTKSLNEALRFQNVYSHKLSDSYFYVLQIINTMVDIYTNLSKVALYIEEVRLEENVIEQHLSWSSYIIPVENRHYNVLCQLRGLIRCLGGEVHTYVQREQVNFHNTNETELRWSRDIVLLENMITNYSYLYRLFRSVELNLPNQSH